MGNNVYSLLENIRNNSGLKEDKELLPSQSSEEDKKALKKLKLLYKMGDKEEFDKLLKKLNMVRKSEGLDALNKNEILSKNLSKKIKASNKEKKVSKEKTTKFHDYGDYDDHENNELMSSKDGQDKIKKLFGDKIYQKADNIFKEKKKGIYLKLFNINGITGKHNTYLLYTFSAEIKEVLGIKTPHKYKIEGKNVIFPDLNKMLYAKKYNYKLKKL